MDITRKNTSTPVCANCGIRASEYEKSLRQKIKDLACRIKTLEGP